MIDSNTIFFFLFILPQHFPIILSSSGAYKFPEFACFYMLWGIELKFCIWLCSDESQIKFAFRQIPSNFEWVMPLFGLRILHIGSFPHFFSTCFEVLSWNFVYGFVVMSHRSSSSFVWFRQILNELCPFFGLGILHIGSFPHFFSTCFEVSSWNYVYGFVVMTHRSSSCFVWFRQILNELCPFLD